MLQMCMRGMASRIWGSEPPQYSPHQNGNGHHSLSSKPLLQHKLKTIEKVEDLTSTFSNTFLTTAEDGSLDVNHNMVPSLADAVLQKLGDALAQQQVSRASMACILPPLQSSIQSADRMLIRIGL